MEQTFDSFRESKRKDRTFEELMGLETNLPGGIKVNTVEALSIARRDPPPRVEKRGSLEEGLVEKYYIDTKVFTWVGKPRETPPTIQITEAA